MATVGFSTTIARPAEVIFDLVADVRRNPEWCPGFTAAEQVTGGPVGRDTAFRAAARGMGRLDIRITEHERPRRLAFIGTTRSAEIRHSFVLTPGRAGTQVTQQIDVRPRGLLRLAAPLMAVMLKRNIQANTAALKAFLERGPSRTDVVAEGA